MDQPANTSTALTSALDDTGPRFALRLDLDGLIDAIAGLLPGLIGAARVRNTVVDTISKQTGSPEIAKLREVQIFFGAQAEPNTPGRRQLQVRLRGNWNPEQILAEIAAHPSGRFSVEERDGQRVLRLAAIPDVVGRIANDGTLVFASDDVPVGPLGSIVAPTLPFELARRFDQVPLFGFSRRGGPWWNAISTWIHRHIPAEEAELAASVRDALQHVCLSLDGDDQLVLDLECGDLMVADRVRARLETLRQDCVGHLSPERLEPGAQCTASPVFKFFTMPLAAAMPVLQILRHVLQQMQITTEFRATRVRLPLRVAFASLSSPIALFSLLPVIPALVAAATAASKPVVAKVKEAMRDRNCSAVRQTVINVCRMYCCEHVSAADANYCPDLTTLRAAGYLTDEQRCPQGGEFAVERRDGAFAVTCSHHEAPQ